MTTPQPTKGDKTMSKTNSNPKTAKHTPGPWTINPPATCNATFPRTVHHLQFEEPLGQKNEICVMVDASFESDANARLIAAAPALLADIEMLREALQLIGLKHPGYGGSGDIARKALAATEVKP
jgi:hypothetical protein